MKYAYILTWMKHDCEFAQFLLRESLDLDGREMTNLQIGEFKILLSLLLRQISKTFGR